jgi:nicotinamidase-related amidase
MQQALVLVDIQNDYFLGGAMELVGSSEAAVRAAKLLQCFRRQSLPIIHIQHVATREVATFFLPNTSGVAIHESVAPLNGEAVLFHDLYREGFDLLVIW